ncbi:MAG: hypothetical protein C0467_04660 [Planctomycetaceae bacterium]|nr:hypothetical protein [Planctomycetaceae bacterium]
MRVLQAKMKRPLDLLAIGAGGHITAACSLFDVRGGVDVWEVATGKHVFTHTVGREVNSLTFTPDGNHFLVGGEAAIVVFDLGMGELPDEPQVQSQSPKISIAADGSRLLVAEEVDQNGRGRVICYAVGDPWAVTTVWSENPGSFGGFYLYDCPAISPDCMRMAVAEHYATSNRVRNTVQMREAEKGIVLASIEFGGANPLLQLAFSADSAKLLARSSGRTVKVFDVATGQPAGELVHPGRPYVTGMAVHPNGTVACSRNNGTVCFWNLEKCELVRTLDWKLGKLVSVAFSPDGSIGAAGTEDGQVVVWDVDI